MKSYLLASVVLATSAAGASAIDDVRCTEIKFSLSAENRDAGSFRAFIDADARFLGNSVTRGPAAIAAAWRDFFADDGPTIKWRPQFVEVLQDGTLALTRGPYRMIVTDEQGVATEHWGTFNSVWRLQDNGAWKVVFDAGSPSPTPPSEATRNFLDEDYFCAAAAE